MADTSEDAVFPPEINLAAIGEIAYLAVRRANTFLSLGLQAADSPSINVLHLPTIIAVHMLPQDLGKEQMVEIKREFGAWIVGSALRELLDHVAIFLDRVYEACGLFAAHGKPIDFARFKTERRWFAGKSVSGKLLALERQFGVKSSHAKYLDALKAARNCLTHRLGVVGPQDCPSDVEALKLTWMHLQLQIARDDGTFQVIPPGQKDSFIVEGAGIAQLKFVEWTREFALGTRLKFELYELRDILWTVTQFAQSTLVEAEAFARKCGVPVPSAASPASI